MLDSVNVVCVVREDLSLRDDEHHASITQAGGAQQHFVDWNRNNPRTRYKFIWFNWLRRQADAVG